MARVPDGFIVLRMVQKIYCFEKDKTDTKYTIPHLCKNELGRKRIKLHKINYTWFFEISVNRPIASIHDKPLGFTGLTVFILDCLVF